MPITYCTSIELDLTCGAWSGHVTLHEIMDNLARYVSDRNYRAGRPELNDLSRVHTLDLSFNAMHGVIRRVDLIEPERHLQTYAAIWAPGDTAFAAARMYQQLVDAQGGRAPDIFRTEREALAAHGYEYRSLDMLRRRHEFLPPDPCGNRASN